MRPLAQQSGSTSNQQQLWGTTNPLDWTSCAFNMTRVQHTRTYVCHIFLLRDKGDLKVLSVFHISLLERRTGLKVQYDELKAWLGVAGPKQVFYRANGLTIPVELSSLIPFPPDAIDMLSPLPNLATASSSGLINSESGTEELMTLLSHVPNCIQGWIIANLSSCSLILQALLLGGSSPIHPSIIPKTFRA